MNFNEKIWLFHDFSTENVKKYNVACLIGNIWRYVMLRSQHWKFVWKVKAIAGSFPLTGKDVLGK